MNKKVVVFLTGTRADFGKLKSLITILQKSPNFEVHVFATGMHMMTKYGYTINEIIKSHIQNIFPFINGAGTTDTMDLILANTINGFSRYLSEIKPDLIVVHGDRSEALAGAIVGSLNNILVAHIEGGEVSGTIDEVIRHAVSKLSHIHFVSNSKAANRLIQMGESRKLIYEIGSPDIDLMNSKNLPSLNLAKSYYDLKFDRYAILIFHPVTTELTILPEQSKILVDSIIQSGKNYIVIYPNSDTGSEIILNEYNRFKDIDRIKVFPSLRFEFFLVLLKNAEFIIGNSSAGIREAPIYKVKTINIGSRQKNRVPENIIESIPFDRNIILKTIANISNSKLNFDDKNFFFGDGKSDEKFLSILETKNFWLASKQKEFKDL